MVKASNFAAILFFNILASLDRFGIKNILFMTLFFIKWSRPATGQKSPVFEWPGYQMSGTGIRSNLKTDHGSVFGGSLYSQHLKTGLVQFSNGRFVSGCRMVRDSKGKNENRTQIVSKKWPFEYRIVQISDVDCILEQEAHLSIL
jgi:hypothetical protein